MEEFQLKMINRFNNNFNWIDVRKLLNLYEKDEKGKFLHPLFKNYNYCFFCGQTSKTKYYSKNIEDSHMILKEKTMGEYLINNNFKLKQIKDKKEKIAKRRFIHSFDNMDSTEKNLNIIPREESDTELFIYYNKTITKLKREKTNISNKIENKKKKKIKTFKKSYSMNKRRKNEKMSKKAFNNYNNGISNKKGKKSIIYKSTFRNFNLDDDEFSTNEKQININTKIEQDDVKTNDINISIDKNNYIIDIKGSNDFTSKKRNSLASNKKKYSITENNLIETSHLNSEIKLNDDDNEKNKNNKSPKKEEEKSNKIFTIFKEATNFFGFGKRFSQPKLIKRRSLSNNYPGLTKVQTFNENDFEGKLNSKKPKNFSEKNDNCNICLQEIKEKFTLLCGDFFCRDCLRQTILTYMKRIANLDELHCPLCEENIEENTIKKLLNEEEFRQYKNLMLKIEGLKKREYIPCPYPDCPGWADETQINHGDIVYCQYGHDYCKICLKIIDINKLQTQKHKCFENISEEEQKTKEFFKNNSKSYRKCPNCRSIVVREGGGCNNMTCTNIWCGYEFCWICNKKYDEMHYKNLFSMCFGLSETKSDGKLAKYSRIRFCRCLLIFIIFIFIILPVILVFFSIFAAVLYIITFVLDGSAMKNIKLKSFYAHKFFYKIVYVFFLSIGVAYIPIGYMSIAVFTVGLPITCIMNKIRHKNEEELD